MAIRKLPSRIIDSSQYLEAQGLKFPGTQVASTDANTLDDYEEGTFTPTIIRSGSNPSYTASYASGNYAKVGNLVHIQFLIIVSSVSSSGSGNIVIDGLPFTSGTGATYSSILNIGYNDIFDAAVTRGYVSGSQMLIIPTGITQSNYNGVLSAGYFGVCGTYLA